MRCPSQPRQPSAWACDVAERAAGVIVEAFDAHGQVLTGDRYGEVLVALRASLERTLAARQTLAVEERATVRVAWARAQHVYPWSELPAQLGLSVHECRTAEELGYVVAVEVPYALRDTVGTFTRDYTPAYYRVAVPLGAAERAEIAAKTLLTRNQAAARLGISAQTFDRRYTQAGLAPAVHLPGTTNHSGWPSHLYRLADVEALRTQDE